MWTIYGNLWESQYLHYFFFEINQKNSKKLDHVEALLPCATSLSTLTEMLSSLLRAAQA